MALIVLFVCIVFVPQLMESQMLYPHPGQYGSHVNSDVFQQQQSQQQIPMHQQQQNQIQAQQLPIHHQQQQLQMHQQQQNSIEPQQIPIHQQQQHLSMHQPQQMPMHPQQQYYQGNIQSPLIQSSQPIEPIQPPPLTNQYQQTMNDHLAGQAFQTLSIPTERYLVGNLSEPFSFQIAPPSVKVNYLGLNGYPLFIMGMGFSNKSKFNYDEKSNRLTILSLDSATVGYYAAIDSNWQTFVSIISAIDVSSLKIVNAHASEDNNSSSLISCSVSIIRSTYKLSEPPSSLNSLAISPQPSLPASPRMSSTLTGTENLPRIDLFLSTRARSSTLMNNNVYNDSLNEQIFLRTVTIPRPLTRADHNGTVQCQVESNNNNDIFLIKTIPIDVEYGPNLEAGALPTVTLETEALKMIAMECQVEGNPSPSYVWYEMANNISAGMMSYYGQNNPYGQQYPLQPPSNIPPTVLNTFGTTRQIQRIFQNSGQHSMQCQAQSRGKTVKQDFFITVYPSFGGSRTGAGIDGSRAKSYNGPLIIGLIVGGILLLLVIAATVAAVIFLKRRKNNVTEKNSRSSEKASNDKKGKPRWGHSSNLAIDYSKCKNEASKGDSSSTSHLVESAESSTSHAAPPVPHRSSPVTSTRSSYRQAAISVPVAYQQANVFPGSRPPPSLPVRSYSPDEEDGDDADTSINPMPLATNRSRTTTPFGSHRSLSESIQSLRSNQQPALSLPVKKRSQEPPPLPPSNVPKRDQQPSSPKSYGIKKDYQHHYHNPEQLAAQQPGSHNDIPSDDEEFDHQKELNDATEDSAFLPKKFTFRVGAGSMAAKNTSLGYNQHEYHQQQHGRRVRTPPPPQKMVVHQPTTLRHDDIPPSYHQVANPSSSSTAYVYQEPTEV